MTRNMYINVSPCFTRIAIVENDILTELTIEGKSSRRLMGNIYKGRVTNVLAGIQAAFVDIGLKRDAFLYIHDILDPSRDPVQEGPGLVDGSDEFSEADLELDSELGGTAEALAEGVREKSIHELVQPGQKILVQITREPMEMKGARVTTHITLPGRYLVLMASSEHVGVSKRIESEQERTRLKQILEDIRPADSGLIVRTAAEGMSSREFMKDVAYLSRLCQQIRDDADRTAPPALIYHDLDTIPRVMRDQFDETFERVFIDSPDEYHACREFVGAFAPELIDRIRLYDRATPLFERFNLEQTLEEAIARRVALPSGGYLIFDDTEAMTVIDVNTGRYAGKQNLEETVLKTNLEAAEIIARQIRLRDIGGIIVIDFIDMELPANRTNVVERLRNSFLLDRSKVNISDFTQMGLVEMTRKRLKKSLSRTLLQSCPICHGSGKITAPQVAASNIIDALLNLKPIPHAHGLKVVVHPTIKGFIEKMKSLLDDHFRTMQLDFFLGEDERIHRDQHQVTWF
ncbi:Rne/Rng family ribonuclease [bacterium]|nr:Rne/Rng family ribonuclease [candidate division CSSED10-310 bacterium]